MTREEIYDQCVQKICNTETLLMELATGTGKTRLSIMLTNYLLANRINRIEGINILILVAKRVHKQTWKDEIEKWGGFKSNTSITVRMECYESMHKCEDFYDIVIADEVHHIGSDMRLELLKTLRHEFFIGLSATIPRKLSQLFRYRYHAEIISCDIIEAIESDILPEPTIVLFPLMLDNRKNTETWEINAKASGPIMYGEYKDRWKLKKSKSHAIISLTQRQKLMEYDGLIKWEKKRYMQTRNPVMERSWLFHAGKRLEFLADCKKDIVLDILRILDKERTITFCKTIEQSEVLGKNCIHSQNSKATDIYDSFNKKKINHITAVNILNENANLVDCKYAIFANISSSSLVTQQRWGRSMRHENPVIIIPYYKNSREEEIVEDIVLNFNKEFIKVINSIQEIKAL